MNTEITIKGRVFTVEMLEPGPDEAKLDGHDRPVYKLTGKRGADYRTFRNVPNPDRMYLVGFSPGNFTPDPLGRDVWLTDRNGVLEVIR